MKLAASLLLLAPTALLADLHWPRTQQSIIYEHGSRDARMEFTYRNTGKTPLTITEIKGGCTCCTSAKPSKKTLAPGESGTLSVRVAFSGKRLPLTKPLAILTDDGKTTILMVTVTTADGQPLDIPKWGNPRPAKP